MFGWLYRKFVGADDESKENVTKDVVAEPKALISASETKADQRISKKREGTSDASPRAKKKTKKEMESPPSASKTDTPTSTPRRAGRPKGETPRTKIENFDVMFERVKAFTEKYGHSRVPLAYEDQELAKFCKKLRNKRARQEKHGKLNFDEDQVKKLDSIGFVWHSNRGRPKQLSPTRPTAQYI